MKIGGKYYPGGEIPTVNFNTMRNKNEFRTIVYLRQELIKETIKAIHEDLFNGVGSDPLKVPVNNEDIKTGNSIVFIGGKNVEPVINSKFDK